MLPKASRNGAKTNKLEIWGRLGGMRGVPGEDKGGVREPILAENRGREPRAGARSSRLRCLARRPRWGGGALRAFRRAEIIIETVPFDSYLSCVVGFCGVPWGSLGGRVASWVPRGRSPGKSGKFQGVFWRPFGRIF